ncbi:MAG: metal-sulfur cluster assembly factor [Candidatus Micrarchaeota archaeon]
MVTKDQIMEKLTQVLDPELGINIVDMGLIYEIEIKKKKSNEKLQKVFIKMTFTTPACPLINEILQEVQEKLDEFEELDIEVNVVFEPLWSPERMSEKAKIKLGII